MSEISIFARTYDLLPWLVQAALKYPRKHHVGLTLRTQQATFECNELIVLARSTRDKRDLLLSADVHLEQLRLYLRLAHDLRLLTLRQYEHVRHVGCKGCAPCSSRRARTAARARGRGEGRPPR